MTYRQLFESFKKQLFGCYDSRELESMFFLVLESVSNLKRIDFFLNDKNEVTEKEYGRYQNIIDDLKSHKPIQYVLKEAWFNGHKYFVNENVLVPRPETEELVHLVRNMRPEAHSIIDLGTGSGCIAIELSLIYEKAAFAMDISSEALEVAKLNANGLNASVNFIHESILNENLNLNTKFDIIISNPPYVMEAEKTAMKENVLCYEPEGALFVNNQNPLIFYKAIKNFAIRHAYKNTLIALEINEQLGEQTAELFKQNFNNVTVHKDINKKDRFITAIYGGE